MAQNLMVPADKCFGYGGLTAAFGTAIVRTIQARRKCRTRITKAVYKNAGTAHTLTFLRALDSSTVATAAVATDTALAIATTTLGVNAAGGTAASGDYVVVELDNGTFHTSTISAYTTGTLTLNTAMPSAAAVGRKVWLHGVVGDGHSQYALAASTTTTVQSLQDNDSVCESASKFEPIIVHVDNITAAGKLEQVSGCHTVL